MSGLLRFPLRALLGFLGNRPRLKRFLVDIVYRAPALDAILRSASQKAIHPEARLDIDARLLPDDSRASFDRIKARTPR